MVEMQGIDIGDIVKLKYDWVPDWSLDLNGAEIIGYVQELSLDRIILSNYNPKLDKPSGSHTAKYELSNVVSYEILKKINSSSPAHPPASQNKNKVEMQGIDIRDIVRFKYKWESMINYARKEAEIIGYVRELSLDKIVISNYNPKLDKPSGSHTTKYKLCQVVSYEILKKINHLPPIHPPADQNQKKDEDEPVLLSPE